MENVVKTTCMNTNNLRINTAASMNRPEIVHILYLNII